MLMLLAIFDSLMTAYVSWHAFYVMLSAQRSEFKSCAKHDHDWHRPLSFISASTYNHISKQILVPIPSNLEDQPASDICARS